jgi:periplasmic divalent cation tolerance protein
MPHTDAIVIFTTMASDEEGVRFVRTLLDRRLIACGTLLPGARSLYRWQGKVADEREVVVMLKTRSARL